MAEERVPKNKRKIARIQTPQDIPEITPVRDMRLVRILNNCKQMIPLQLRPPGTSFFRNEQQIRLNPGQHALLPYEHLRQDQIENLCKKGMIKIIYDTQKRNSNQI